jgi:hypothetical protein
MMVLSLVFAALSASLWLVAALAKLPTTIWLQSGVGGGRPSSEMEAVLARLRWQSRLNAAAAFCMFVSTLLQFMAIVR